VIDTTRILLGLLISTAIGAVAYRRGSLSRSGWLGAIITGTLTFGFGGWAHGVTLVFFFVSSTLWSRLKKSRKAALEATVFEKGSQRDIWQALANGGVSAMACVGGAFMPDTWATELGILSTLPPRLITTMAPVPRGTSGAISTVGTLATGAGALTTATVFVCAGAGSVSWYLIVVGGVAGVIGSLSDSVMGATVQRLFQGPQGITERAHAADGSPYPMIRGWRWMNNDAVNCISAAIGAGVAAGLWMLG
jgi:uncharacterized protein (TIGR00297 family)